MAKRVKIEPQQEPASDLAADLLWGVESIAKFIGVKTRRCYWLVETRKLPVRRIGNQYVASKTRLREWFMTCNHEV